MRVLITGAAGLLGQDVHRAAAEAGHEVHARSRRELDVVDQTAVWADLASVGPELVVNCAAWTDVDGAEHNEARATAVNGAGAGHLAAAAAACGAWILHVSSDYVFDGRARRPYVESSATGPLSAYGRSKLAGEQAVAAAAPGAHTIVRTAWMFGTGGPCFPATIRRLAAERDELRVVDDQVGCPTFTGHLAPALIELAASPPLGIVHMAGSGSCSWCTLAQAIVAACAPSCEVRPGRTDELGRPAPRPAYSVLGSEREGEVPLLPPWRDGLRDYLASATVRA